MSVRSDDPDQRVHLGRWAISELMGLDVVDEPLPEGDPPPWPPRVSADYAESVHVPLGADAYPGVTRDDYREWTEGDPCSDPRAWRGTPTATPAPVLSIEARAAVRVMRARHREAFRRAATDWANAVKGVR
jgi:hypothetical protein